MADVATHSARRELIRRILRTHLVATQEDLGRLLAKEGIEVNQATLSRDLARLMARRVTLPDGGTVYELAESPANRGDEALRQVHHLVTTVDDSDAMIQPCPIRGYSTCSTAPP